MKWLKLSLLLPLLVVVAACQEDKDVDASETLQQEQPVTEAAVVAKLQLRVNMRDDGVLVSWPVVQDAVKYRVRYQQQGSGNVQEQMLTSQSILVPVVKEVVYDIEVAALTQKNVIIARADGLSIVNKKAALNDLAE